MGVTPGRALSCLYYCIDTHFEAIHNQFVFNDIDEMVVYTTA